jgi:hypothetical protein
VKVEQSAGSDSFSIGKKAAKAHKDSPLGLLVDRRLPTAIAA